LDPNWNDLLQECLKATDEYKAAIGAQGRATAEERYRRGSQSILEFMRRQLGGK
jgi:hypothetical protein